MSTVSSKYVDSYSNLPPSPVFSTPSPTLLNSLGIFVPYPTVWCAALLEWKANRRAMLMSLEVEFADSVRMLGSVTPFATGESFAAHLLKCRLVFFIMQTIPCNYFSNIHLNDPFFNHLITARYFKI